MAAVTSGREPTVQSTAAQEKNGVAEQPATTARPTNISPKKTANRIQAISPPPTRIRRKNDNPLRSLTVADSLGLVIAVISVTATFVFGAWAIKSSNAAETANSLSGQQLQIAQDPLSSRLTIALLCATLGSVRTGLRLEVQPH